MSAFNGRARVSTPLNEPIRGYAPGSPERASLKATLDRIANEQADIPIVIGGQHLRTGVTGRAVMPHDHQHVLGTYHKATPELVHSAVDAARGSPSRG